MSTRISLIYDGQPVNVGGQVQPIENGTHVWQDCITDAITLEVEVVEGSIEVTQLYDSCGVMPLNLQRVRLTLPPNLSALLSQRLEGTK